MVHRFAAVLNEQNSSGGAIVTDLLGEFFDRRDDLSRFGCDLQLGDARFF